MISIIIPVYNEEKTISQILKKICEASLGGKKEIIVVDDGSFDKTKEVLDVLQRKYDFIFLKHDKNKGKGAAIKTGLEKATGDMVVIQDADLEYDPSDLPQMMKILYEEPEITAVYGSRKIDPERRGYFFYFLGNRAISFLINILFGSNLTDSYTCYKLFRTDFLKSLELESNGFEIEAEMTCKTLKRKAKIKEAEISYNPRTFEEGKHIRIKDGLIGFFTILKYKF